MQHLLDLLDVIVVIVTDLCSSCLFGGEITFVNTSRLAVTLTCTP